MSDRSAATRKTPYNNRTQPRVVSRQDEFQEALGYIGKISRSQGFTTEFLAADGEIAVAT